MKSTYLKKYLFITTAIFSFVLLLSPSIGIAQKIPPPEEFFGFKAGADFYLINYGQAVDYWKKLEKISGKIKLFEYGKSSEGKTMILAVISSEENMAILDHYKELSKRLSLIRGLTDEEAGSLASDGHHILPETAILKLDKIKGLMDSSQLISEIETGFVLYCEGQVVVPPVGFLPFDQPQG